MADVRFHSHYIDIPNNNYTWSREFSQFPGFGGIYPGETFVLENGHAIIRATNAYWQWSIYLSLIYIAITFSLKYLMSKREKGYDLKRELMIWNWILAVFSGLGVLRCFPEFVNVLTTKGFVASYTENTYIEDIRVNAWYLAFTLSKAPELVDTMFIILRKRPLINLHWIHHTLTLIYSWFVFGDMPSTARWMVNMNLFIHTFMYSYFALSAMSYRLPRWVSISITSGQITQMFFGLYINIHCLYRKIVGAPCDLSFNSAFAGFSLYFLFFCLFVNFFIQSYLVPGSKKAVKVATKAMANGKTLFADLNNNASNIVVDSKACSEVVKKLQ